MSEEAANVAAQAGAALGLLQRSPKPFACSDVRAQQRRDPHTLGFLEGGYLSNSGSVRVCHSRKDYWV